MPDSKDKQFLERRRQLLRMGAAGMPMALTLRAGAAETVISQLRCVITIPDSMKILVDQDGAAWVGDRSISQYSNGEYKPSSISRFKDNADYSFSSGSVPSRFRPECDTDDECDDDDDDWWSDADFDLLAQLDDRASESYSADYISGSGGSSHGHSWDDDDDDCDEDEAECYTVYRYSRGDEIKPGNYTHNGNGWSIGGTSKAELYIALSLEYEQSYGGGGNWPGISCIVSVVNYFS